MSSYKLLEIYRLIQAYNIPWNLNFQTVYENPEKTLPRTRPRNNKEFSRQLGPPQCNVAICQSLPFGHLRGGAAITAFFHHVCDCTYYSSICFVRFERRFKIFADVFTLNFEITSWFVCSQISWPSYLMGCITPILLKISSTPLRLYVHQSKFALCNISFVKWHRLEWTVITLTCYID